MIAKKELPEDRFTAFFESSKLMNHRGPDYCGMERISNVLLIHYRLSILDLDSRSNQPFHSHNKQYNSVYNGEIYNFLNLKNRYGLKTYTTSDTEIMLETFVRRGKFAVPDWNGIFAIGIHQIEAEKFYLIRDRFGVKPIYIYEDEDVILFASEAKVIYDYLPSIQIDINGLAEYLWYGNTISNHTIVKSVFKVKPASILTIDLKQNKIVSEEIFWTNPGTSPKNESSTEIKANVLDLLDSAVKRQMVADVPIGVLLSGGVDSSAIVALGAKYSNSKLDTYSLEYDFNIGGKSEMDRAKMMAKMYQTNHHELKIEGRDIVGTFQNLVYQYDEPFADAGNIPLYELAKMCSKDKKVILQGDGGDEFFGGYRSYNVLDWLSFWKIASYIGHRFIYDKRWSQRMKRMSFLLNQKNDGMRMAYYMTEDVPYSSPYGVMSNSIKSKLLDCNPFVAYLEKNNMFKDESLVQKMLYTDVEILLPHTFLEKVDKATMLCSIEARVPFLDNDLTQYVLSLPSDLKVKYGQKKYLLKQALQNKVPDEILYGKKKGFDVPYKEWLRGDLYNFTYSTFDELTSDSILNKGVLLKLLENHNKRLNDHGPILWKSLVLATWLKMYSHKLTN